MRYVKKPGAITGMMSEQTSFNNCTPKSSIFLEERFFIENYKALKKEMAPDEIVDFLVQHKILNTDENSSLLNKSRRTKCDIILRKLIRSRHCRLNLVNMLHNETQENEELVHFNTVLRNNVSELKDLIGEQGNTLPLPPLPLPHPTKEVLLTNLQRKGNKKRILQEFKRKIESECISDDFLQEHVINVDAHEEISFESNKTKAAEMLYTYVVNSPNAPKLLTILKSLKLDDLADRLQQSEVSKEENTDGDIPLNVTFLDGKMSMCIDGDEETIAKVEVIISTTDGKKTVSTYRRDDVLASEEYWAQNTHSVIEDARDGSIIILLKTESVDALKQLRYFIENGDIITFLKHYFERKDVRKLLKKNDYRIKIQIRKVQTTTTEHTLQRTEDPNTKFKSCLERCHDFLLEELEPGYFLRDEEIAPIFRPVMSVVMENMTNRTKKIETLLEHLRKRSEEEIKLVLDKVAIKNRYISAKMFPNTEKYSSVDIEQVKRNIFNNLPEVLEGLSIHSIRTPFLSTGIISLEELNSLRSHNESERMETLQFIKLVLQKGAEAVRILLLALEKSCNENVLVRLLKKETSALNKSAEGKSIIKYEAFEDNDLLFVGNFQLELSTDSKEDETEPETGHLSSRAVKESISSEKVRLKDTHVVLRCHMCEKPNPPPYCDDCHISLYKNNVENYLDTLRIHKVEPIQSSKPSAICKNSTEHECLHDGHQNLLQCQLCRKSKPTLYCDYCNIDLCKVCARKHLFDESKANEVVHLKRRWSFEFSRHSTNLPDQEDGFQDVLKCHICKKTNPTQYCDLCHINLCKTCVTSHLFDKSETHKIDKRWSYEIYNPQNVLPCNICERPISTWYCDLCHINLCRVCAVIHLSCKFRIHLMVPNKNLSSFEFSKHSTKLYASVHKIQNVSCHMCEKPDPSLFCKLCHINVCKVCAKKHLFEKPRKHKVEPIKHRWSVSDDKTQDTVDTITKLVQCYLCDKLKPALYCRLCHLVLQPLTTLCLEGFLLK